MSGWTTRQDPENHEPGRDDKQSEQTRPRLYRSGWAGRLGVTGFGSGDLVKNVVVVRV